MNYQSRLKLGILSLIAAARVPFSFAEDLSTPAKDIVDLLREKKIEVKTQGSGIKSVAVEVRRKGDSPVTVKLPVGTFFVSANRGSQNMVTTASAEVTLADNEWHSISAAAACANRPRHIPGGKDSFSIQRAPNQKELAQLMPALDKANADYATRQAAVWIVTDDASYGDLGTLQASRNGVPTGRVINEIDAAAAMKICSDAGLSITSKAIWDDRSRILKELADGEVKQWLQQKMAALPKRKKR